MRLWDGYPGLDGESTTRRDAKMGHAGQARVSMELPEDPDARATFTNPTCVTAPLTRLDLAAEGISAVIWATGYGVDFGWIDLPVTDAKGEAMHRNGISTVPGLYFLGLQWLSKMNSSFLSGVGDDAVVLADHILGRR